MPIARVLRIREPGGPEVLELGELPVRDPAPGELLVQVAAAGVNRADVLQRRGRYPAPRGAPPDVPGLEYAGAVLAAGDPDSPFRRGDRVMGITGGGAMSTHLVVHEREAIRVPGALSLEDAAAVPEVFLTVFDALFAQARLRPGETVLVHAIGSGIGTAALQVARVAGARVVGTSRTKEKLDRCAALGLDAPLLVTDGRFADRVKELTDGRGADVVLDTVGADYLDENVNALAPRGRMVVLGLLGGASKALALATLLSKRLTITGSVLRSRPLEEKAALAQAFAHELLPHFESGRLRPVVDAVLPMADAAEAHRRMERNENFGKYVLRWD